MKKSNKSIPKGLPPVFVDVLFIVILFFVTITNITSKSYSEAPQELSLPALELAKLQENTQSDGNIDSQILVLSLQLKNDNNVHYFIDEKEIPFSQLISVITQKQPNEVCLRIDEKIKHGDTMNMISLCQESGIRQVSFAYTTKS